MWEGLECTVVVVQLFQDSVRMNCWKLEPSSSFLFSGMGLLNRASASVSMMMQSASVPCQGTVSHSWCTNLEAAPPTPTTCTEHTQQSCCCCTAWVVELLLLEDRPQPLTLTFPDLRAPLALFALL